MGASDEGAEMMTFLAPPFKWAEALGKKKKRFTSETHINDTGNAYFSVVVKTP